MPIPPLTSLTAQPTRCAACWACCAATSASCDAMMTSPALLLALTAAWLASSARLIAAPDKIAEVVPAATELNCNSVEVPIWAEPAPAAAPP